MSELQSDSTLREDEDAVVSFVDKHSEQEFLALQKEKIKQTVFNNKYKAKKLKNEMYSVIRDELGKVEVGDSITVDVTLSSKKEIRHVLNQLKLELEALGYSGFVLEYHSGKQEGEKKINSNHIQFMSYGDYPDFKKHIEDFTFKHGLAYSPAHQKQKESDINLDENKEKQEFKKKLKLSPEIAIFFDELDTWNKQYQSELTHEVKIDYSNTKQLKELFQEFDDFNKNNR